MSVPERAKATRPNPIPGVLRRARSRLVSGRGTRLGADAPQAFPPGNFYSPVVSKSVVFAEPDESRLWPERPTDPSGVDMCDEAQLALLSELAKYQLPKEWSTSQPGYDPSNDQFPPHDAAVLYAMICHLRPARIVEVGCGWSTTVTARAIEDARTGSELTCVDPFPRDFLHSIDAIAELRAERVEHTPMAVFEALGAGDVLFIDSSHVAKTGSDVVHQLLEVLPRLVDGVVVHVHDIFIPEDYPKAWVGAGFGWNEQYLLQAFLSGNRDVEILAMNHWLALRHPGAVHAAFDLEHLNGSSAWFRQAVQR